MQLRPNSVAMTVLLASMTAIGPVTMDIYLASMPYIGPALGGSTRSVQLTLSSYVIGFAIGQLFYGPLSDSYGRRPPLLFAFALYLIASTACALAGSVQLLIIARLFQALGAAGPIIIARTIVRDLYSGAQAARQLGLMSAIMGVMPIGAPVLGGYLQTWFGWRSSFISVGLISLVLALTVMLFLPETRRRENRLAPSVTGIVTSFGVVARSATYRSYLAMLVFNYMGVFGFISTSSYVLQTVYHVSAVGFGLTFALISMAYICGTSTASRLVLRRGIEGMLRPGKNTMLAGALLQLICYLVLPHSIALLIIPQMIFMVGSGLMVPQLIAGGLTPFPERAGAASSLMGCVQMSTAAAVGALVGVWLGGSAWPLITITGLSATAVFVIFRVTEHERDDPRHRHA